jgi:hypothetical protein
MKTIPKLKASRSLRLGLDFTVEVEGDARQFIAELKQALADHGLSDALEIRSE